MRIFASVYYIENSFNSKDNVIHLFSIPSCFSGLFLCRCCLSRLQQLLSISSLGECFLTRNSFPFRYHISPTTRAHSFIMSPGSFVNALFSSFKPVRLVLIFNPLKTACSLNKSVRVRHSILSFVFYLLCDAHKTHICPNSKSGQNSLKL